MSDNFNNSGKKGNAQPYDSKINEQCPKCSGNIVYRKSTYFGNKVYYKVCNNCGWYITLPKEVWKDIISVSLKPAKATPTESAEQDEQIEAIVS
ncbi:MAG TPA: hypothetical protein PLC51_05730 [Candidatus Marinimicrobia bacterium]|jgi:ssDNA-binding Zn-finger/Zn-ribbon topoisomerase 1|nr:hypothetical protein [Candidatus Neomarinimicrobiota bacterium]HQC62538.1 hypothetical protein [Candidatus Neomarinimicrobiota bacterium]